MAMSGSVMAAAKLAAVNALPPGDPTKLPSDIANVGTQLDALACLTAMDSAEIAHIQLNANLVFRAGTDDHIQKSTAVGTATDSPAVTRILTPGCIQ